MKVYIGPYNNSDERHEEIVIDDYDTWNMDNTLAKIIHPMLVQLKDTNHGIAEVNPEDVSEEFKNKNPEERWDWVMDEMIWAFSQKLINWEDQYHSGNIDLQFEKIDENDPESLLEIVTGPNDTHVFDSEGWKKHYNRMKNGFELFGKYYESLWD